jgi:lysyl-tRNA synthetase, class I
MRWHALGVDYEMSGKDLIDSVKLVNRICRVLGGEPPDGFNYELFLDENGQKISKSKGNGLTIEEWLRYAARKACSSSCTTSRARPSGCISTSSRAPSTNITPSWPPTGARSRAAPVEPGVAHPFRRAAPRRHAGELCPAAQPRHRRQCRDQGRAVGLPAAPFPGRVARHPPRARPARRLCLRYFEDFVKPHKRYRLADETEREALQALSDALAELPRDASAEDIQGVLYDVGRAIPRYQNFDAKGATPDKPGVSLAWFNAIYQILLGEEKGPRFGSFVALYGIDETRALIARALSRRTGGGKAVDNRRHHSPAQIVWRLRSRFQSSNGVADGYGDARHRQRNQVAGLSILEGRRRAARPRSRPLAEGRGRGQGRRRPGE